MTSRNADGDFETITKTVEGPVSLITTTTMETLEKQIESRMISVSPDESTNQTRKILSETAVMAAAGTPEIDPKNIIAWQDFHKNLNLFRWLFRLHKTFQKG